MLEAPLPLLVGITKREYKYINLTEEEKESKVWVFLDTGEIKWIKDDHHIPLFSFNNLA